VGAEDQRQPLLLDMEQTMIAPPAIGGAGVDRSSSARPSCFISRRGAKPSAYARRPDSDVTCDEGASRFMPLAKYGASRCPEKGAPGVGEAGDHERLRELASLAASAGPARYEYGEPVILPEAVGVGEPRLT
jgi:hypothetical protein